jgi:hypothetical protein
VTVVFPA